MMCSNKNAFDFDKFQLENQINRNERLEIIKGIDEIHNQMMMTLNSYDQLLNNKDTNMRIGNNGIELIKKYEGFMSEPYKCPAGVPTIGYGATYYTNGRRVTMNDEPISKQDAETLLIQMLGSYENAVNRYVRVYLTQNQFDSLVSFTYNLGAGAFKGSTLLKKINLDPCNPEIRKEFGKWVNANGKKLKGLVRRREEEADLYFS